MRRLLRKVVTSSYVMWVAAVIILWPVLVLATVLAIVIENTINFWNDITHADWELPISRADYEEARREDGR